MRESETGSEMAARLTGWHIDIKSESQRREAIEAKTSATRDVLTALPGVGPKLAENLSLARAKLRRFQHQGANVRYRRRSHL